MRVSIKVRCAPSTDNLPGLDRREIDTNNLYPVKLVGHLYRPEDV